MPRLADFNAQEPDIDVRIKAVDMDEGSLTDDVDVAIHYGRGTGRVCERINCTKSF